MSFLGSIASVMEGLGLKGGMEIIYATVTSAGYFLPELTIEVAGNLTYAIFNAKKELQFTKCHL